MAVSSVSYTKTPQAGEDSYTIDESALDGQDESIFLDVMSNDLGGNAKTLYSIEESTAVKTELLIKDTDLAAGSDYITAWEQTEKGNWIRINNGKVEFKLRDANSANGLDDGDSVQDSFVYAIQLGNGTISYAKVTLTIAGANDAPILATVSNGSVTDTAADDSYADVTGTLTGSDPDSHDTVSFELGGSTVTSEGGYTVEKGSAYGTFYLNTTTGAYKFVANDAAVEALKTTATVDFVVNATDGTADSATQTITISLNGVNDTPVINSPNNGDPFALSVAENIATSVVVADVNATDADGDTIGYTLSGADAGLFNINATTGEVTFKSSPNYEVPADSNGDNIYNFTVVASDGSLSDSQSFAVTVTDVAEGPTIASPYTGPVPDPYDNDGLVGATTSGFVLVTGTTESNDTVVVGTSTTNSDSGSNEKDIINGYGGDDTIYAGDATDQVYGGSGVDTIYGGGGGDKLYGQAGGDTINGNELGDDIYGGSGNDVLNGNDGNDTIYGGSGGDTIDGGLGADTIIGGYGADTLTGGDGADTFKYLDIRDTGDVINVWVGADDTLDFSAIAGITGSTATNTSNVVANSVTYHQDGTNTVVWADTDGNTSTVEMQITLTGVTAATLVAADFVL